jgi:hypothetical protein
MSRGARMVLDSEIQAHKEGEFPKRMYVYHHRIFDRYDQEVISLAIPTDDDPDWRPSRYEYARWGFRASMEFPIVKLLDYAPNTGSWNRIRTRAPWSCWRT